MDEWVDCTLGDVLTLQRGFDLPVQDRRPGPYPVIASTGQVGTHDSAQVTGPGVVIGRSGSIGGGQYIPRDFWPLNTTLWVADFKGNDPRFCYYLLRSIDLSQFNVGSGVPTLNRNHVHPLPVRVPPTHLRKRIGEVLGALDDKIESIRRMNETLEVMAQSIFRDWFVDFGPVRRKLAGERDAVAIMGGLMPDPARAAELAELFPNELNDDALPAGWEMGRLADFTDLQNGYAFKSTDWREQGVPVVKIGSVKPALVDLQQVSFVSAELAEARASFRLAAGDILVGLTGYVGETGRIPPTQNPPMLNQRVARFVPKLGCYDFVYACARDKLFKEFAENNGHGSAQANVSTRDLLAYPVVKATNETVGAFGGLVAPLLALSLSNAAETETLAETRDYLLPRFLSGRVRVATEAEAAA